MLQEAEALQSEMRALERERAGLLRDVALQQEMEAQYAKRGTLQVWRLGHSIAAMAVRGFAHRVRPRAAPCHSWQGGCQLRVAEQSGIASCSQFACCCTHHHLCLRLVW